MKCKDCGLEIRNGGSFWEHIPINGAIPKHPARPTHNFIIRNADGTTNTGRNKVEEGREI